MEHYRTVTSKPQQAHPNPSSQQSPPSQTESQPAVQADPFMMTLMELLQKSATKNDVKEEPEVVVTKTNETDKEETRSGEIIDTPKVAEISEKDNEKKNTGFWATPSLSPCTLEV